MSDDPRELTFYTDVKHALIEEIADLPVKNENWRPGEKWAKVEGCLIFRGAFNSKIRTTLSKDEVRKLIRQAREAGNEWITVPHTIRDADAVASMNILRPL